MFCGVLLGHGSIGTSWVSAAIDDLAQGKLKQELLLFTEQKQANSQCESRFYFLEAQVIFLKIMS